MKTREPLPKWAVPNAQIQRKPCGRACRIVKLGGPGALVKDGSVAVYVSSKTLANDWKPCAPSALQKLLAEIRVQHKGGQLMPAHLRTLADEWIAEGCEGLT